MSLNNVRDKLLRLAIPVLRFFHSIGGGLGLWNHYHLYGKNVGEGFTVHCNGNVLMYVNVEGYEVLHFSCPCYVDMTGGKWRFAYLRSTYDWPTSLLGEYKSYKVTFINW